MDKRNQYFEDKKLDAMVEDKKAMDMKYRELREDYNFEKRKRDAAKENAENIK